MKNKAFGLDIGISNIKVVWLSKEKNGYSLNAVASAPTPSSGMLSESPFDQEHMAQTIRKIVTEARISTPYVNISIAENQAYTKVVEMPNLSDKELSSAIYWEAEQYIPVPLQSVMFDYKVLRRPSPEEADKMMEVLLVAAPTTLINKYQKVMSLAGLIVSSVETEMLSTIRALILSSEFPPSLIISIGAVSTSIAIVKKGILVFTYFIPVGGVTLNRAIAEDFGLSISQAAEYKNTYGVYGQNVAGKIGKASEPILMSIISEVRKALAFYKERFNVDDPVQQILLSGETAKLPGIDLFFAQNCGIETATANPWKALINQQLQSELIENAPDYSIVTGLAMKDHE